MGELGGIFSSSSVHLPCGSLRSLWEDECHLPGSSRSGTQVENGCFEGSGGLQLVKESHSIMQEGLLMQKGWNYEGCYNCDPSL